MEKILKFACLLFLSVVYLVGCGGSNGQNNIQASQQPIKSTNNPSTKTNNNQAQSYNGWITVKVEGEVEFQIPPTMEIQSEDWKSIEQKVPNFYNIVTDEGKLQRIVAQQKGLNTHEESAKKQYARAIVKIGKESGEAYPKWGDEISFSTQDLRDIEEGLISGATQNTQGLKLVGISQHLKAVKVNGISCLNVKYETQLGDKPIVKNELYMFWNGNRMYTLQTLIRSTEYEYWTSNNTDMRNIVNTFNPLK